MSITKTRSSKRQVVKATPTPIEAMLTLVSLRSFCAGRTDERSPGFPSRIDSSSTSSSPPRSGTGSWMCILTSSRNHPQSWPSAEWSPFSKLVPSSGNDPAIAHSRSHCERP